MFFTYGAIPKRGLPLRSWPKYGLPGRYGDEIDIVRGGYVPEDYLILKRLREEQDILEIITILCSSGVLN